jgi:hypothetical protein
VQHRICVPFQVGAARQDIQQVWRRLRGLWIQPGFFQRSCQDDWHAMVEPHHEGIGFGRDDGAGVKLLAIGTLLDIVETGERNILGRVCKVSTQTATAEQIELFSIQHLIPPRNRLL